jgi:DNA ligase-associated metallophosphoesterase
MRTEMQGHLEYAWGGDEVVLTGDGAVVVARTRTAYIADVHFGKASTYRHAGVPVPSGTTQRTIDRMTSVVRSHPVERLVILGDLLHAAQGRTPAVLDAVSAWRGTMSALAVELVRGNHDARAGDPPAAWRMVCRDEPAEDGPWRLAHDPACAVSGRPTLAGHLHPAVRLQDVDGARARFPCFWCQPELLVLPPFGPFTGHMTIRPSRTDAVFVVIDGAVMRVPAGLMWRK